MTTTKAAEATATEATEMAAAASAPALDPFTRAYIEAALWAETDNTTDAGGRPFDVNYSMADLAPELFARMLADCAEFQAAHAEIIVEASRTRPNHPQRTAAEFAGHDFWLTRNGHGAGFWDGDWTEPAASLLTAAAEKFGEMDLYIGDDGLIYSC